MLLFRIALLFDVPFSVIEKNGFSKPLRKVVSGLNVNQNITIPSY
jgi:hypothetical protein